MTSSPFPQYLKHSQAEVVEARKLKLSEIIPTIWKLRCHQNFIMNGNVKCAGCVQLVCDCKPAVTTQQMKPDGNWWILACLKLCIEVSTLLLIYYVKFAVYSLLDPCVLNVKNVHQYDFRFKCFAQKIL